MLTMRKERAKNNEKSGAQVSRRGCDVGGMIESGMKYDRGNKYIDSLASILVAN